MHTLLQDSPEASVRVPLESLHAQKTVMEGNQIC
jgi:hypothetical protein